MFMTITSSSYNGAFITMSNECDRRSIEKYAKRLQDNLQQETRNVSYRVILIAGSLFSPSAMRTLRSVVFGLAYFGGSRFGLGP